MVIKSQENKRRKEQKTYKNNPKTINKMAIKTYISIIPLNVNGLNTPIKTYTVAEWIQNQDLYISCQQETLFRSKDTCRLKVRRWKKIFHANGNQSWDSNTYFRQQTLKYCYKRQGHYLKTKGSIQEDNNCKYICMHPT